MSGRSRSASVISGSSNSPSYLTIAANSAASGSGYNSYDNGARQAFHGLLETVKDHYENKLLRIAGCLAEKVAFDLPAGSLLARVVHKTGLLAVERTDERRAEEEHLPPGLVARFVAGQRVCRSSARLFGSHSERPGAQSSAGRLPAMRGRHLGRAPARAVGPGGTVERSTSFIGARSVRCFV